MSSPAGNGNSFNVPFEGIASPEGFDLCWAGPSPLTEGLCFGSVDGRLYFRNKAGSGEPSSSMSGSVSLGKEAINGVARVGTWIGVSTRSDINFWPLPGTIGGHADGFSAPVGAHDIVATESGFFIAPMGDAGIMTASVTGEREPLITVHNDERNGSYVYKIACLRESSSAEVLACAIRTRGIAVGTFSDPQKLQRMTTATFHGLDVVDVCPLAAGTRAAAALARDGSVILFEDVMSQSRPLTMKFKKVQGIAYRLLCYRGEIYVLTSKALYVLGKLAARFLNGEMRSGVVTHILNLQMEAVDLNIAEGGLLLVVMDHEVRIFNGDLIHGSVPKDDSDGSAEEYRSAVLDREWHWNDVEQTARPLAMA